jgi:hypothetical protein
MNDATNFCTSCGSQFQPLSDISLEEEEEFLVDPKVYKIIQKGIHNKKSKGGYKFTVEYGGQEEDYLEVEFEKDVNNYGGFVYDDTGNLIDQVTQIQDDAEDAILYKMQNSLPTRPRRGKFEMKEAKRVVAIVLDAINKL